MENHGVRIIAGHQARAEAKVILDQIGSSTLEDVQARKFSTSSAWRPGHSLFFLATTLDAGEAIVVAVIYDEADDQYTVMTADAGVRPRRRDVVQFIPPQRLASTIEQVCSGVATE